MEVTVNVARSVEEAELQAAGIDVTATDQDDDADEMEAPAVADEAAPEDAPADLVPWFDAPGRGTSAVRMVFGHWSTLGLLQRPGLLGLDTGCVWGGTLTGARLTGPIRIVFEQSPGYRSPSHG